MAASLIRCIGTPRALAKLKPTHPLPKFLHLLRCVPCARARGTDRHHVESPPACALFKSCDQLFWSHARPGCKYTLIAKRHEQFYACAADIEDQDFSLHERPPLRLSAEPDQSLQDALRFRFCRRAGRPAFHNFKREESEQH